MSDNLTHWKKNFNPNYLGAYAFDPGEEKTVVIQRIAMEDVLSEGGKKERKQVIHFENDVKPLITNKTNAKMIERVLDTPFVEQWIGKSIVLGVEKASFGREKVDAVRVKNKRPQRDQALLCDDCGAAIVGNEKLSSGQLVAATQRAFRLNLCAPCAKSRKEQSHAQS